jgi:hypothetical protein
MRFRRESEKSDGRLLRSVGWAVKIIISCIIIPPHHFDYQLINLTSMSLLILYTVIETV